MLIVDEADRLKVSSLEELRDIYDGLQIGMVLIGMPGLERKLARYAQLYSRIGFLHEYKALSQDEKCKVTLGSKFLTKNQELITKNGLYLRFIRFQTF